MTETGSILPFLALQSLEYLDYLNELDLGSITEPLPNPPPQSPRTSSYQNSQPLEKQGFTPSPTAISNPPVRNLDWINTSLSYADLKESALDCQMCQLCQTRKQVFWGQGPFSPSILFVIDPPDERAEEEGQLPVGIAKELLNNIIVLGLKIKPEEAYITPIVKCRPPNPEYPPQRTLNICSGLTKREIDFISPKVVIALGATASQGISGSNSPMGLLRPKAITLKGKNSIPVRMTYGLEHMLAEKEIKKEVWQDLKKILRLL